ncbi:nuclear exosome regulator NRDE2 isoform X1 [Falco biarmicus]|uniref:nuclear exosome regulator NRDE2 isoform X1 n=1 Tax=Falco rusticolus TaxID=120794 RepID=UPI0018868C06|nr:nuclear exosome regulator NRDE2 isoform X1 [Falco rusticolus]XP_056201684.1 nuclear exosome regulator NRDE2 isoform X1 [Falco biarmicus]
MALFPAFAGAAEPGEPPTGNSEGSRKELDWLSNPSFSTEDALLLHQRTAEAVNLSPEKSPLISRTTSRSELSEESDTDETLKQSSKKRKKKKKKHHHYKRAKKKTKGDSSNSESDLDTKYIKDKTTGSGRNNEKEAAANPDKKTPNLTSSRLLWLDDIQAFTAETFRIDKKPDPANWAYKSLYRGDIARYKRRGESCLGIDAKKQCITWDSSASKRKQLQRRPERYFTKNNVKMLNTDGILVCSKSSSSDPAAFVPVFQMEAEDPSDTTEVNPLGIYDPSTTVWLQGNGSKSTEPVNAQQAVQEPVINMNSILMTKVEEHNKKVRENPRDINAWMEFVSFQDELMRGPSPYASKGEQEVRRKSLKLILEKKLAILERAIESNPSNVDLKLARLKICAEFWEPPALIKEWQKLIFLHPNNPELWKKYLLFCQSQFTTFSVSKINSLYGKCLTTLAAVQDGSMVSHPLLPGTEEAMLAIFIQQCHFLRQAGHSEKAVSLFQALIDFTFFKPDSVKDLPTRGQVEFFEPFWDSGEPRIGEKGARGWKAWMHQQEKGGWIALKPDDDDDDEEIDEDQEIKDKTLPKWHIWLDVEYSREARHWLPWRPDKTKKEMEEDCEDPERQVLFDDLGPSLIQLSNPDLQRQLLYSFLQFLGVPCTSKLFPSNLYIAMDENNIFESVLSDEKPLTSVEFPLSGFNSIGHMDTMLRGRHHIGHYKEGEEFIQNVFHVLFLLFSGKEKSNLSICWLQYEISKVVQCLQAKKKKKLKAQGRKSKKLAKNLLKAPDNRNHLSLWKLYAYLEWLLGNIDDARKVFDTALCTAGTEGLKSPQICSLSLLYAQLEVELLESIEGAVMSRAVHILTKLAESGPYVPYSGQVLAVNVLKARKTYEHALQDYLSKPPVSDQVGDANQLVNLVGCYALFQYLTVGIDAAVLIYAQTSEKLEALGPQKCENTGENFGIRNFSTALEAVTLLHTNLLRFHMKISVYPLNPLREALTEALKRYPSNRSLWRSYIHIQRKSHSASKARRFFDGVTRSTNSLEPWLFAIQAEQMRKKLIENVQRADVGEIHSTIPETGLTNRIVALFEHAVQSENGTHCPLLWRMYLNFLTSLGKKEKSRGLFYKALQNCPWAKVLYMDAVEYFPDHLQETLDLMTEKELRVRVPVEELDLLLEV